MATYNSDTSTLTFNTNELSINTDCTTKTYSISWGGTGSVSGTTIVNLLPDMAYSLNFGPTKIRFDLNSSGEVVNIADNGVPYIDFSGASLTFKSCWCDSSCS